jgi:hypothetical protein
LDVGGKEARRWGGRIFGTLLFVFGMALPAQADDIEVVTSRFCDLPANEPIFIDNANMGEDDEAIAARIAAMLRMKGVKVLDDEPDGDGDNLILTFELDRFVPERPDDKSGFGFVVKGASGSGVSARIIVPKLRKDYVFGPMTPKPPPGPILTFDMTLDFGTSRRVWLGRASAPLGHRAPLDLELEMADRLVNALMSPPDDKCVAPPE